MSHLGQRNQNTRKRRVKGDHVGTNGRIGTTSRVYRVSKDLRRRFSKKSGVSARIGDALLWAVTP